MRKYLFPSVSALLPGASFILPHCATGISVSLFLSLSFSSPFSICEVEPCSYLMCSSFSISISRQVASGAMLEPVPPTPPIYLPCATPRMATCLWMVAMLTMSQVRFIHLLTKTSPSFPSRQSTTWVPSSSSVPGFHLLLTPTWPGGHWKPMVWKERLKFNIYILRMIRLVPAILIDYAHLILAPTGFNHS